MPTIKVQHDTMLEFSILLVAISPEKISERWQLFSKTKGP